MQQATPGRPRQMHQPPALSRAQATIAALALPNEALIGAQGAADPSAWRGGAVGRPNSRRVSA